MYGYNNLRGSALALASLSLVGAMVSGCVNSSDGTSSDAGAAPQLSDGVLLVGQSPDFPPMEFREDGSDEIVGFDSDFLQAIGDELGVTIEISENKFDQLIPSLQTGRVEVVMSGISDTTIRQESADFIDYMATAGVLYTLADRAEEFTEPQSICGKTLSVSGKTDYLNQVEDLSMQTCENSGLPAVNILEADSGAAARLQLTQGRADLAAQGRENLSYINAKDNNPFAVVLDPLPETPFGIMVGKNNTELRDQVLEAAKKVQESGKYDELLEKWNLSASAFNVELNATKS